MKKSTAIQYLGKSVFIKIDRPLGSIHPEYGFTYELNYGYIPDTKAEDGEAQDAYVLGVSEPLNEFSGVCVAVIERINDEEDKLIVTKADTNFLNEEILALVHFQERFFTINLIRF